MAAARLAVGRELASEETGLIEVIRGRNGTVGYYCHAGLLEMTAPVHIHLKGNGKSEAVVVALLWGGQLAAKSEVEMEERFRRLQGKGGMDTDGLRAAYRTLDSADAGATDRLAEDLHAMAEAISRILTDAYRSKEMLKADKQLGVLTAMLGRAMERVMALGQSALPGKWREDVQVAWGVAMKEFASAYNLRVTAVLRIDGHDEGCLAEWVAGYPILGNLSLHVPSTEVRFPRVGFEQVDAELTIGENRARDPLVRKTLNALGVHPDDPWVAVSFSGQRPGKYLWVIAEQPELRWEIRREFVQRIVYEYIVWHCSRVVSVLDTVSLLEQIERKRQDLKDSRDELVRARQETVGIIRQLSHAVTRPILELELAASSLVNTGGADLKVRDHFGACMFELRHAAQNFVGYNEGVAEPSKAPNETPKSLNIHESVMEAINDVEPLAKLKQQPIEVRCSDRLKRGERTVWARKGAVRDMVKNLVHNAVKYSFGGRPVWIDVRDERETVAIDFRNFGCGIRHDERDKVFKGRYRSEMARQIQVEGAGLGLWIVKTLAGQENGSVELVSSGLHDQIADKAGNPIDRYETVFRLTLPCVKT